jgi:hypothetical protein
MSFKKIMIQRNKRLEAEVIAILELEISEKLKNNTNIKIMNCQNISMMKI